MLSSLREKVLILLSLTWKRKRRSESHNVDLFNIHSLTFLTILAFSSFLYRLFSCSAQETKRLVEAAGRNIVLVPGDLRSQANREKLVAEHLKAFKYIAKFKFYFEALLPKVSYAHEQIALRCSLQ